MKTTTDINITDIDKTIESNLWTKKFHTYLEKRSNGDNTQIQTLKFRIKMEAFNKNEKHLNKSDKELRIRREMFTQITKCHFDLENDVLALSNGTISDYLCTWTSECDQNGQKVTEHDVKYLLNAMEDPTVTSEGLEPTYQKFLSQVSTSRLACILSILWID